MKKVLFFMTIVLTGMYSCTDEESFKPNDSFSHGIISKTDNRFRIDESDAIDIANRFFKNATRSAYSDFNIEYIIDKKKASTRNESDEQKVLAYILNRSNNNGFIVISSDNRIFPILAYSDTGTFSYKEDMSDAVYANFVSRIDVTRCTIQQICE